jgi:alcohol dehydrogenase class IV
MPFELVLPRRILFGTGTFSRLGEVCRGNGRCALLVTGRSALRRSGRLAQAEEMLAEAGIAVRLFEGVENDPSLATCDRAIGAARDSGCDLVVAIGGGSALDVGKIVAAILPQSFTIREFFQGQRDLERPSLFLVAAPTTAGTGSECTRVSVLTDEETQTKKGIRHPFMAPQAALVDPELTLGLPPEVTAQSGMDALTQAIESCVGRNANPVSDGLALQAIELLARHLPATVEDGSRIENREPVALASLLTGMAFTNTGLGAVHGLAHPVGALFHAPHGLVCALLLPHVCEFNLPAQPEKFDRIAALIGCRSGRDVPAALSALNRRVGLEGGLGRFGLKESAFARILADSRSGSTANNPRSPSDADLAEILRKAM